MENLWTHEKIISVMCRLCLASDGIFDMFSFSSELESPIADAVTKCTSVHIEKQSELPSRICEPCYMQLIKTHNFQRQVLKSDNILQLYLKQLQDDDKQTILGSPVTLNSGIAIDGNSSLEAIVVNQDTKGNIDETKRDNKDFENGREEVEIDIVDNKVFALDLKSRMGWDVHSFDKDSAFNTNLIVKSEPIISDKNLCHNDIEILNDFAVSQEIIKSEKEDLNDKTTTSYQCDFCNKCFKVLSDLSDHQPIHTGEKPYQCDACSKCFSSSGNLRRHQRVHTGEKPYQCVVCKKCFNDVSTLRRHKRLHTGVKPYQCDVCKKYFNESGHLRTHRRLHTGEKPYQCAVCNKCFNDSSTLRRHKRLHTGEKPYQCDVCNKCFGDFISLKTHQRIHVSGKPYQCDVCSKCYNDKTTLRRHKRVHTGERPYQCDICNQRFSISATL